MDPYPQWVYEEARVFGSRPPRLEASLYGIWNGILNAVFPAPENYIVKPQGPIRQESARDSLDSWTSVDSYRRYTSSSSRVLRPDFIVARYGGSRDHTVLLVVEVKRADMEAETSSELVLDYVETLGYDTSVRDAAWIVAGNSVAHCRRSMRSWAPAGYPDLSGSYYGESVQQFMEDLKAPDAPSPLVSSLYPEAHDSSAGTSFFAVQPSSGTRGLRYPSSYSGPFAPSGSTSRY